MSAPTEPPATHGTRSVSGRTFVVSTVVAMVLFVALLLLGSPVLLERTLERVPPPAPHVVGEGAGWQAVATQQDEDTACIEVTVDSRVSEDCTGVRGMPLRLVDTTDDATLLYGIVDARTTQVAVELAGGSARSAEVTHVDFGFPLGFFVLEADATSVTRVVANDRDDTPRAEARCSGATTCEIIDLR